MIQFSIHCTGLVHCCNFFSSDEIFLSYSNEYHTNVVMSASSEFKLIILNIVILYTKLSIFVGYTVTRSVLVLLNISVLIVQNFRKAGVKESRLIIISGSGERVINRYQLTISKDSIKGSDGDLCQHPLEWDAISGLTDKPFQTKGNCMERIKKRVKKESLYTRRDRHTWKGVLYIKRNTSVKILVWRYQLIWQLANHPCLLMISPAQLCECGQEQDVFVESFVVPKICLNIRL